MPAAKAAAMEDSRAAKARRTPATKASESRRATLEARRRGAPKAMKAPALSSVESRSAAGLETRRRRRPEAMNASAAGSLVEFRNRAAVLTGVRRNAALGTGPAPGAEAM